MEEYQACSSFISTEVQELQPAKELLNKYINMIFSSYSFTNQRHTQLFCSYYYAHICLYIIIISTLKFTTYVLYIIIISTLKFTTYFQQNALKWLIMNLSTSTIHTSVLSFLTHVVCSCVAIQKNHN